MVVKQKEYGKKNSKKINSPNNFWLESIVIDGNDNNDKKNEDIS